MERWIKYAEYEGVPSHTSLPYQLAEREAEVIAKKYGCTVKLRHRQQDADAYKIVKGEPNDYAEIRHAELKSMIERVRKENG